MPETDLTLFLSKLLPVFAFPLGAALLILLLAWLLLAFRWRRTAKWSIALAFLLLWVCSMPIFAGWALGTLEHQYPARPIADLPAADVAILLGGAIGDAVPPRVTTDLSDASDRVLYAARLFKAGKVRKILVSGGNLPWTTAARPEAESIRELLVEWGVPTEAVEIAGGSRNTYENAVEIRALQQASPFASALLVTSAAHMPRAVAVFRHAGVPVTAATTDVRIVDERPTALDFLPDAGALSTTTAAMKEWIGYLVYARRGYL